MKYYGIVDSENNHYGFVTENDIRKNSSMIEITDQEWESLLAEQSKGKEIVFYNGKVFTAKRDEYYIDETGIWQKRTTEELKKFKQENNRVINNIYYRQYLNDTDWKVIRHRDQIEQGITPSLTESEYLKLLTERQNVRNLIINED